VIRSGMARFFKVLGRKYGMNIKKFVVSNGNAKFGGV